MKLFIKLKNLFIENHAQILFLVVSFLILSLLSSISFFQIFIDKTTISVVMWIIAILLFKISYRTSLIIGLILICFLPVAVMFTMNDWIKRLSYTSYGFLAIGIIQISLISLFKKSEPKK